MVSFRNRDRLGSGITDRLQRNPQAGEHFALEGVAAGIYDIRYQNLDSGIIWRSEPFALKEAEDEHQIRATGASLTLYEVPNGNPHPEIIGPEEF